MDAFAATASDPSKRQWATLDASGLAVGLPEGVMGNSEVGHLTIGAGRPEYQVLVRINMAIANGSFGRNEVLQQAFRSAKEGNGRLHFMGLLSDGGVHAHINHLFQALTEAKEAGVPEVFIQAIGDGRDTPPKSTELYVSQLLKKLEELSYAKLATIVGRYFAMDRDKRWNRVEEALKGLIHNRDNVEPNALEAVKSRYANGETDEFLKPIIVTKEGGFQANDTVVFLNFRADRAREISECLGLPTLPFDSDSVKIPEGLKLFTMSEYNGDFPFPVLFPPETMKNVLGEWLATQKVKQFHTAETEKYAHVTFFFNGGREEAFELEDRVMVPSPRVPTYDLDPKMSQAGVADEMIRAIQAGEHPLVMCNFAAPDMVGHTGVYEAALVAVADCDTQIGRIWEACKATNTILVVTSDHGNAEVMKTPEDSPVTKHTTNFVPMVVADPSGEVVLAKETSTLADVAPTVLSAMGLPIPPEMTGTPMVA